MVDFINFSIIYTFCLSGFKLLLVAALSLLCLLFTRLYSQKIGLLAGTIQITLLLCAVLYTHYWWQHPGWCCDYTGFTFRSRDQTWLTDVDRQLHRKPRKQLHSQILLCSIPVLFGTSKTHTIYTMFPVPFSLIAVASYGKFSQCQIRQCWGWHVHDQINLATMLNVAMAFLCPKMGMSTGFSNWILQIGLAKHVHLWFLARMPPFLLVMLVPLLVWTTVLKLHSCYVLSQCQIHPKNQGLSTRSFDPGGRHRFSQIGCRFFHLQRWM